MNQADFLQEVAQLIGAAPAQFNAETRLKTVAGWDSLGKMAVITLLDEVVGVELPLGAIDRCQTAQDLVDLAGGKLDRGL